MDFVLSILPLGLVRLRSFRLSTWVTSVQTWAQVLTRARGGCVIHRYQNKNPLMMWMTSCTRSARGGFGEIWKKGSWVENKTPNKRGRLSGLAEARRICARRAPHEIGVGADGKASRERLCLSPYVEEPLNSKVIKSFVLELRSRKCFLCFGIPMFYVYMLWTFYVPFAQNHIMTMVQTVW